MPHSLPKSAVNDFPLDDDALLCPSCGYDLRAAVSDRCSECGTIIDRAKLKESAIPWSRRRQIGRIRAYIKTVWLITIGGKSLAHEAVKPQKLRDALAFRRITAFLIAIVFLAAFIAIIQDSGDLKELAVPRNNAFSKNSMPAWVDDLWVPWSAGAINWVVLPLMLLFFAWHVTGVQRRLFKIKDASPQRQERAAAMAYYSSAPLAWLFLLPFAILTAIGVGSIVNPINTAIEPVRNVLPLAAAAVAILGICVQCRQWIKTRKVSIWIIPGSLVLAFFLYALSEFAGAALGIPFACSILIFLIAAIPGTILQIAVWSARVRHSGFERALLDVPHLLGLWLFGAIVLFGFLPWCVGFVWIVIDSFL
jgi:hypothetical protein